MAESGSEIQQDITKDTSLTEAITAAVESHDSAETTEDKPEAGEDKKGAESESSKERDEEAEHGKLLVQALKDPQRAGAVIDFLATQAGYTKQSIQTKEDVKEARKDINSILEESLGDEFKFLAPKLAPAIKNTLEALLEERADTSTKELRERMDKQELKEIQAETERTHKALAQEWFGSDEMPQKVVDAMSAAIDEFPPSSPEISPEKYYKRIFNFVVGELELTRKGAKGAGGSDRISRNAKDSVARNLASTSRGVAPSTEGAASKKMSLKDAVALALEQVEEQQEKK